MKKYLFLLFLLSGCSILDESKTERRTVTIACNKGSIQSYLNDGWTVENSNTRQVTCVPSNPPIIGTEVEYIISRKSKEKRQWVKGTLSIPRVIPSITKKAWNWVGLFTQNASDSVEDFIYKNITGREIIYKEKYWDRKYKPNSSAYNNMRFHIYYNKTNAIKDAEKYNCYFQNGSLDIIKYRRYDDPKERRGWQICRALIWPYKNN